MPTSTATSLQYEAFRDRLDENAWRVEAIDAANDGDVYITLFMGPNAKERAIEYAQFKNR
jgi:hypothetical protein